MCVCVCVYKGGKGERREITDQKEIKKCRIESIVVMGSGLKKGIFWDDNGGNGGGGDDNIFGGNGASREDRENEQ